MRRQNNYQHQQGRQFYGNQQRGGQNFQSNSWDRGNRGNYENRNSYGGNNTNRNNKTKFSPNPSPAGSASDLTEFGDMGAAAKTYAANVPKYQSMRNSEEGGRDDNLPTPPDNNPYRKEHNLTVFDSASPDSIKSVPNPYQKFEDFPSLSQEQLNSFYGAGFSSPTPIQAQTWPIAMMERDVISIAKTGSGKTLAFLLPLFRHIADQDELEEGDGPIAIIMTPTRELCLQVDI